MSFRFRKSLSIFKGVRLNFGKRGVSLSFGGKGMTANLSEKGVRTTIGIPGSGLSYTTSTKPLKIKKKSSILTDNKEIQTVNIDVNSPLVEKFPNDFNDQLNINKNHVDDFAYLDEDPSNLNIFFTTMTLVFLGGLALIIIIFGIYFLFF